MIITHSSATPFDNVDPDWRTYCGLTADRVAELVVNRDEAGNIHSWMPGALMTCPSCRAVLQQPGETMEAWLVR
jgi:hypothetical protein